MEEVKETKTKYLESRLKANRKYYEKNKEKMRMVNYLSNAKTYIKKTEDIEKLKEVIELANEKLKELEENIKN